MSNLDNQGDLSPKNSEFYKKMASQLSNRQPKIDEVEKNANDMAGSTVG